MGLIRYTPTGATEIQLSPNDKVFSFYEDQAGAVYIRYKSQAKSNGKVVQIQESLTDIFNQQANDGTNLKMILITDIKTGNRMILITTWLKQIVSEGAGARIAFLKSIHDSINTTESLNDIFAYQGGGGSVDLNMVFVERTSDSQNFIIFDSQINKVLPHPASSPTGSEIQFDPTRASMFVNQLPIDLYSDQPQ